MRIVKIKKEIEGTLYFNGHDLKHSDHWLMTTVNTIPKGSFYSNLLYYNKNDLRHYSAEIKKDYLAFELGSYGMEMRIKHQIPENLIEYTGAVFTTIITDIKEASFGSSLFFDITKQPLIRLIFDGPEELGLVWRLSI